MEFLCHDAHIFSLSLAHARARAHTCTPKPRGPIHAKSHTHPPLTCRVEEGSVVGEGVDVGRVDGERLRVQGVCGGDVAPALVEVSQP